MNELQNPSIKVREILIRYFKYNIAIYLGISTGFLLSGAPEKSLWMVDSYTMHLPGSVNIAGFLHGKSVIRETSSVFDKIYFTHYWTGLWFWLIGVFPVVSTLAMLPIKSLTAFLIFLLGKKTFGEKEGLTAALIYIFMPTVLFYTVTFYKEPMIHLAVAAISLATYCIFRNRDYKYFFLLVPSFLILSNERFYLFPIFLGNVLILTLSFKELSIKLKFTLYTLGLIGAVFFLNKYQSQIPILRLKSALEVFRANYNSYSDVNSSYNSQLIYPLAFIKLIFTPFFTFNKFKMFYDFSYLLIWGSLLNQFIIFLALFELCRSIKKHWFFLLPLVSFLIIFAYISPYNGRLRDSFYPIIVVFSTRGFYSFQFIFLKIKLKHTFKFLVLFLVFLLFPLHSNAALFWSAKITPFNLSTVGPIDTSYDGKYLYAITRNGLGKSLFVAISENGQWNSYLRLPEQQTILPPKTAFLRGFVYFFYINHQTNHLHFINYNGTTLGTDTETPITSDSVFEIEENGNQILLAIKPINKKYSLYSFDGTHLKKIEEVPIAANDTVISICSRTNNNTLFYQKLNDSQIWSIQKKENKWSNPSAMRLLKGDIFSPTIKCIDNQEVIVTTHKIEQTPYLFTLEYHKVQENKVLKSFPLDIITRSRASLVLVKNIQNSADFFPRILYIDQDLKAAHQDAQVESIPGVLESIFHKFF